MAINPGGQTFPPALECHLPPDCGPGAAIISRSLAGAVTMSGVDV